MLVKGEGFEIGIMRSVIPAADKFPVRLLPVKGVVSDFIQLELPRMEDGSIL